MKLTCTLTGTSPDYGTVYVDENMNLIHAPAEADANDTLHLENGILSVETEENEYRLNGNVLGVIRHRLNGSVTAEAWVYTAAPEKLVEFKYDSNGLRTQKKVTDHGQVVTSDYIYHGKRLASLTCGSDVLRFFYDDKGHPLVVFHNGKNYHYISNIQRDILAICSDEGQVVVRYRYDSWGKVVETCVASPAYEALRGFNPFAYRGYEIDAEIDMYYLYSRYYAPALQRFINSDTFLGKGYKLGDHSLYSYCVNDPIVRTDYFGMYYSVGTSLDDERGYDHRYALQWQKRVINKRRNQHLFAGRYSKGDVYIITRPEQLFDALPGDVFVADLRDQEDSNMRIQNSYLITDWEDRVRIIDILLDYDKNNDPGRWNRTKESLRTE